MTDKEIIEGNKLLAGFLGYQLIQKKYQYLNYNSSNESYWEWDEGNIVCDKNGNEVNFYNDEPLYSLEDIPFKSWDVLMPVVEKIENLSTNIESYYTEITSNGCKIIRFYSGNEAGTWQTGLYNKLSKIESTWYTCVVFVKWLNQNKENEINS